MSQAPVIRRRGSHDLTLNHKRLYGLVRRTGQASRADLTRQSGLTFPSVSRLVAELLAAGMLREGSTRRGGMGKPPMDLSVDPDHGYGLGIDLNGDEATGRLVNALGEARQDVSFPAALSDGVSHALKESGVNPDRLTGVCVSSSGELLSDAERGRLAEDLGVSVFTEPAIACSVKAERYFGSGSELARFVYFDALSREVGALVGNQVLARAGTLETLIGDPEQYIRQDEDALTKALKGAAAFVEAEALVVSGMSADDVENVRRKVTELPVVPATAQASDPTLAAASVPLHESFGI